MSSNNKYLIQLFTGGDNRIDLRNFGINTKCIFISYNISSFSIIGHIQIY